MDMPGSSLLVTDEFSGSSVTNLTYSPLKIACFTLWEMWDAREDCTRGADWKSLILDLGWVKRLATKFGSIRVANTAGLKLGFAVLARGNAPGMVAILDILGAPVSVVLDLEPLNQHRYRRELWQGCFLYLRSNHCLKWLFPGWCGLFGSACLRNHCSSMWERLQWRCSLNSSGDQQVILCQLKA